MLEERIKKALELLKNIPAENVSLGRHDVDDTMYYNVSEYTTKPIGECTRAEAHREYADVQYIVSGEERIDSADIKCLEQTEEYDAASDAAFYRAVPEMAGAYLRPGSLCIYYPENAHMPGIAVSEPCKVRKIVVKVKVN